MSAPTSKDKAARAVHLARVQRAATVLEKHGYNVRVMNGETYDYVLVDRIFAGSPMEKVSLQHVQECLRVNGLGLMYVARYSMLMATVDDVRSPFIVKKVKGVVKSRKGATSGNKSRTGKSKG